MNRAAMWSTIEWVAHHCLRVIGCRRLEAVMRGKSIFSVHRINVVIVLAFFLVPATPAWSQIITEFMAANRSALADLHGERTSPLGSCAQDTIRRS